MQMIAEEAGGEDQEEDTRATLIPRKERDGTLAEARLGDQII